MEILKICKFGGGALQSGTNSSEEVALLSVDLVEAGWGNVGNPENQAQLLLLAQTPLLGKGRLEGW